MRNRSWVWRAEGTAWLSAMVSDRKIGYRLKLDVESAPGKRLV
jgi:hypothetical protein